MKKALETPLQALREDQPTFWQVTQVKSVIVYVSRADGFLISCRTPYHVTNVFMFSAFTR